MKYVVIIAAGAPDAPLDDLEGQTPLQIAATPALDRLARAGRVGTAALTPKGLAPTGDLVIAALLGVDPVHLGGGPGGVLALGAGIDLGPEDWGLVADLISVDPDGTILPHRGPPPSDTEARALLQAVADQWQASCPDVWTRCELHHAARERGVMIDRTGSDLSAVRSTPPWDASGEPWERHAPAAPGTERPAGDRIVRLIEASYDALHTHEVNTARAEMGHPPLNVAWLWGPGVVPHLADMTRQTGLSVAVVTNDPIVRGVARAAHAEVIAPERDDPAALGQATCEAIDRFDLVIAHASGAERAAVAGDAMAKADAIRELDAGVIGPVARLLETFGDAEAQPERRGWRLMVVADRYLLTDTAQPDPTPVPFAMSGAWVRSVVPRAMTEAEANASDLHIDAGHELLEYFLRGGLARVRPIRS